MLSQNILSYTFDYTYWDEMVKFVEKRDLTWAEVNIVATLPNFKINCVWVLDNRFKQFYSYNTLEEKRHDQFPINSETVKEIFLKEKFPHFFLKSGQHLFEIAGAPIQYSADLERKGVPKGYFFTARIWDKKYLDAIGKNNFTTISLYEPSEYSKIKKNELDLDHPEIMFVKTPLRGYNGNVVYYLCSRHIDKAIERMIRSYQQQLPLWFSIGAVVLFAIALLLVLWVIIPIKILSKGLVLFGETEKLKHLAKNKTEFGSFAKLLIEFFHQKESLEKEIKIRKQTDEELRKSESKLHAIFSAMTDIILILDDKGRYLEIAPSNPSLLYRPSNEILGKTMHEVFPKEQADFFLSRVTECLNSMQTVSMEYFLEIDRKKLWFSAILSPLNSNSVLFVARDITETKLAEENLKISDTTFRGILNTINDAIYIQDKDGTFLDVNEGAVQMYGYSREELIGKNPLFVAAEGKNDLQKVVEQVHLAFEGTPQELEFWGKRKNGQIFPKHVRLYKGIYFEKEVVVAVSQDITESKRAEDKLKENEEMFRNLVENITDVFYIADVRGKMKYCSPNFFLFTGFTPQEILNHPYVRVVAPVDQRRVVEHYIGAERSGILDTRIELRVKRKDGIIFWAEQNTRFVRDENGNILEYRTVARDISERKHAEEALKKSEEWFRNLFEKASDGIFHLSLRGELLAVNKAFAMMHGYTVEEMQKMSINDLDTPQTSILFPERMRRVLAGENLTFEVEHYHKNGHTFQLEVTASMITVGNEKFVIAFHRDISERKKAEETIRASEERFRTISYLTSDYIFSTKICSDGKVEPDWV
ncbi:MAG: PAS domain S-box protein, partial [Ignavibacteriaceae bacterium]|nr:PAS domain S-box protein [Ignavibacteriaceae bacterium]